MLVLIGRSRARVSASTLCNSRLHETLGFSAVLALGPRVQGQQTQEVAVAIALA